MRRLYERYWQIASELEKQEGDEKNQLRKLKIGQVRFLRKTEAEYELTDKLVSIIDRVAEQDLKQMQDEVDDLMDNKDISKLVGKIKELSK